MLRSALAVLAGIAVLTVTSFAIEAAVNPFLIPAFPQAVKPLTFAYGFVCVALGGYVTARLARRRPTIHAAAMGIVQAGLTVGAMFSPEANHATPLQWVLIAILSIPAAILGGMLYKGPKADA